MVTLIIKLNVVDITCMLNVAKYIKPNDVKPQQINDTSGNIKSRAEPIIYPNTIVKQIVN